MNARATRRPKVRGGGSGGRGMRGGGKGSDSEMPGCGLLLVAFVVVGLSAAYVLAHVISAVA